MVQYLVFLLQKNLSRKMIQVSCDVLGLEESFQGICFDLHVHMQQ